MFKRIRQWWRNRQLQRLQWKFENEQARVEQVENSHPACRCSIQYFED